MASGEAAIGAKHRLSPSDGLLDRRFIVSLLGCQAPKARLCTLDVDGRKAFAEIQAFHLSQDALYTHRDILQDTRMGI